MPLDLDFSGNVGTCGNHFLPGHISAFYYHLVSEFMSQIMG